MTSPRPFPISTVAGPSSMAVLSPKRPKTPKPPKPASHDRELIALVNRTNWDDPAQIRTVVERMLENLYAEETGVGVLVAEAANLRRRVQEMEAQIDNLSEASASETTQSHGNLVARASPLDTLPDNIELATPPKSQQEVLNTHVTSESITHTPSQTNPAPPMPTSSPPPAPCDDANEYTLVHSTPRLRLYAAGHEVRVAVTPIPSTAINYADRAAVRDLVHAIRGRRALLEVESAALRAEIKRTKGAVEAALERLRAKEGLGKKQKKKRMMFNFIKELEAKKLKE